MPIDKKLISQGNLSSGRTGLRTADSRLRNGNGWRETRLVAKGNAILVATAESNRLTCFDADTGELRWSQPMENGLLLSSTAALQNRVDPEKELDSQVIVIESKSLAAVKLSDGSKLWRIYFSAGERPAGDGVLLGEEYLLPLDSGRLARVSMLADTLQRLSYLQLGLNPLEQRPKPGNLLAHQGALFVRSSLAIERYEQPNTKNEKVVQAESLLTAGESIQAYDAFNQLIGKKPDQLELINRRDASALLGERAEKVTNNLPLSNQLVSEQRIEPLLYRFHSCVRQNNKTEAKSIGADILVRPECKTHYVALSNTCEVLVERWIQSELANLEQMPRAIDLSENKRFTESVDNNKQINRSDWATNQVSTSVTISKSENKQKQRTNFSRRNIRNVNSIPQRLGVRGVGSEISRWEVYNNGGESPELVGRNNFGEIAFATQLPSAVEGPLLASVVGESASCCWGNQVLIQLSDSIVAFDLSNHQESDRVLWNSLTLEEESLEALPLYEVVPNSVKLANRGLLNHSDQGDKLYHTDAWGAVVRRQGKIATVDPKTGKIIWSVNDWHSYDRVFSLEDRIYFGRTSSREGIILSKEDGSTLGNWHVPNGDWRNYCSGRLFLTTRGEAQLYDITQESETPIWQSSLKEKQYVIVDEAILLIDRVGHLVCVDMITGKIRFETNLKLPNSRLPFLQAKLVGKNLIVGLSEQSTSGHRQLGFTPVGERPLITGLLYNLDLMTGNLNWPHAIEIEGVGLLDDDSVDSQLLFFSGREQNMQSNSGISWNRLLVVDLLSGRSLYRNDRLPAARQGHIDFQVLKEYATKERSKASPADQTDADTQPEQVLVQLGTAQVRLELTSEPSPPSPPALAYIERPRKKGVNFNEVGQGLSRLFEEITQPIENPDK